MLNFEQLEIFSAVCFGLAGQTSRTRVGRARVDPDLELAGAAGSGSLETPTAV